MLIQADADVTIPVLFTDPSSGESVNASALPTFRVFGQDGAIEGGNGTAAVLEGKDISAISVGVTTTITSTAHGLSTGAVVTIAGAAGTSNVNGTHQVTEVDANTFTFNDVTSSGTYTSGASWNTPGLYGCTLNSVIRAALEVGRSYLLIAYGVFTSDVRAVEARFTVVA